MGRRTEGEELILVKRNKTGRGRCNEEKGEKETKLKKKKEEKRKDK